jgi:alpha-glucosidase
MHWLGDNRSNWDSLRNVLPLCLSLGLSGVPFTGPDTGGFTGTPDAELLARWNQLSVFTPFFRNHTSAGTGDQEPWALGDECEQISRAYIELRYRLLPYLYTAFWQTAQTGLPMMRALFLNYQDEPYTWNTEDEFTFGDAFLVAPVTEPGCISRQAYLPGGRWYDFWEDTLTAGPQITRLLAPLDRMPILVRAGSVVPAWPLMQYSDERPVETMVLHIYPGDAESLLYEDDGHTWAFRTGDCRLTRFRTRTIWAEDTPHPSEIRVERRSEGRFLPGYRRTRVILHGLPNSPKRITVDGEALAGMGFDPKAHLCASLYETPHPPYVFEVVGFRNITVQM